jgi:hypothetical protein
MGRRVGGCYIHRSPFVVRTHVDEDSGSSRVPFKSVGSRNVFSQSAQHHRRHLTTTALMPQRTARCSAPDFRGGTSRRLAACFGSRGSGARIPPPRPFLKKRKIGPKGPPCCRRPSAQLGTSAADSPTHGTFVPFPPPLTTHLPQTPKCGKSVKPQPSKPK